MEVLNRAPRNCPRKMDTVGWWCNCIDPKIHLHAEAIPNAILLGKGQLQYQKHTLVHSWGGVMGQRHSRGHLQCSLPAPLVYTCNTSMRLYWTGLYNRNLLCKRLWTHCPRCNMQQCLQACERCSQCICWHLGFSLLTGAVMYKSWN